jgi:hypothetical protein
VLRVVTTSETGSVAVTTPCVSGSYSYTRTTRNLYWTMFATSYGYDAPVYQWSINGVVLVPSPVEQELELPVEVHIPAPPLSTGGATTRLAVLYFKYTVTGNRLDLILTDSPGNCSLLIAAVAGPSAPQNLPSVAGELRLPAPCVEYEWEPAYEAKLLECFGWAYELVDRRLPDVIFDPVDPPFHHLLDRAEEIIRLERTIGSLIDREPERAASLIELAGLRFDLSRATIDEDVRLFERSRMPE